MGGGQFLFSVCKTSLCFLKRTNWKRVRLEAGFCGLSERWFWSSFRNETSGDAKEDLATFVGFYLPDL